MDERVASHLAFVGLGSNLDEPRAQVEAGLEALSRLDHCDLVAASRLYASAPVGFLEQPNFVNAVAIVRTEQTPLRFLATLQALERELGKVAPSVRFGPRRIDLDLLLYDDLVLAQPGLVLPHPRLHERAFVLYPLAEVAPDLAIPGRGRVADLRDAVDATGVMPLGR